MTQAASSQPLRHSLLISAGVEHGFGTRDSKPGSSLQLARARQVHGVAVASADASGEVDRAEADAVVSCVAGIAAAIVTADCVPILVSTGDGSAVAAIHAGWRGLAQGVIEAGVKALLKSAPLESSPATLIAVVGPHIGPCCYEVDDAVLAPLRERFPSELDAAIRPSPPSPPGHAMLDLAQLAAADLSRAGLVPTRWAALENACTRCDARRFHSYRRDGAAAGRLLHYVAPRSKRQEEPSRG